MDTKTKVEGAARKAVTKIGASPKSASSRQSTTAKKTVAVASSPKSGKAARQPSRTSRSNSDALVCRYCGSDDLAPSFKKRRDARCRACFKKRYASSGKKTKRIGKTKASK
jgi:hypothetical protein